MDLVSRLAEIRSLVEEGSSDIALTRLSEDIESDLEEASRARDHQKLSSIRKHTSDIYKGMPDAVVKYGHEAHLEGAHARNLEKSKTAGNSQKVDAHRHAEAAHAHAATRIKNHVAREVGDPKAASMHPAVKLHTHGEHFHKARRAALGDRSESVDGVEALSVLLVEIATTKILGSLPVLSHRAFDASDNAVHSATVKAHERARSAHRIALLANPNAKLKTAHNKAIAAHDRAVAYLKNKQEGLGDIVRWGVSNAKKEFSKTVKNAKELAIAAATGGEAGIAKAAMSGKLKPVGIPTEALDPKDVELSRSAPPKGPKVVKDVLGRPMGQWQGKVEPAAPKAVDRLRRPKEEAVRMCPCPGEPHAPTTHDPDFDYHSVRGKAVRLCPCPDKTKQPHKMATYNPEESKAR